MVVPLSLANLNGTANPAADELVAWDELGAGLGDRVAISEGAEATQPFRPALKPVDVYHAAILERIALKGD
jgi:ethanolamine utilization protein EutN